MKIFLKILFLAVLGMLCVSNTFAQSTATQAESVTISSNCGPPGYACSSRSTAPPVPLGQNLTPIFSSSSPINSTAHDPVNPSTDCITRLTDGSTWGGQSIGNLTVSGGDNEVMSSKNSTYFGMACCGGQTWIFHMDTSGSCMQNITNGTGKPSIAHGGSFSFSRVTDNVYYQMTGSRTLNQNTITSDSTITATNNSSFPFDFSTCPGVPAADVGVNATWNSNLTVADDDSMFSLSISWTGGQGTGILSFFYKPGVGCSARNWQTGDIWTFCASNCQAATPAFNNTTCLTNTGTSITGLHNTQATSDHTNMVNVSTGGCTNIDPLAKGSTGFWLANSNNVQGCAAFSSQFNCTGHDSVGFDKYVVQNNPNPNIRTLNPLSSTNIQSPSGLHVLPTFSGHVEFHAPWPQPDNSAWVQVSSGTNGDGCIAGDSSGYLHPAYGCNAMLGVDTTNSATPLINFGISYNSAQPTLSFGCNQTIAYGTKDGRWLLFTSTILNNLGFDNTGKPRCDVFAKKLE